MITPSVSTGLFPILLSSPPRDVTIPISLSIRLKIGLGPLLSRVYVRSHTGQPESPSADPVEYT